MQARMLSRSIGMVILLLGIHAPVVSADTRIRIGEQPVMVTPPGGMQEVTRGVPQLRKVMENFTASTNRLLLGYLTSEDVERMRQGMEPEFLRYAMVQTFRDLENRRLGQADIEEIKRMMRGDGMRRLYDELAGQIEAEVDGSSARFSQEFLEGKALELEMGRMEVLGLLFERPNATSHAGLIKYQSSFGDGTMVMGNTTMVVNGKVLYAFLYSDFEGKEDVDWVAQTMQDWVDAINAANP